MITPILFMLFQYPCLFIPTPASRARGKKRTVQRPAATKPILSGPCWVFSPVFSFQFHLLGAEGPVLRYIFERVPAPVHQKILMCLSKRLIANSNNLRRKQNLGILLINCSICHFKLLYHRQDGIPTPAPSCHTEPAEVLSKCRNFSANFLNTHPKVFLKRASKERGGSFSKSNHCIFLYRLPLTNSN